LVQHSSSDMGVQRRNRAPPALALALAAAAAFAALLVPVAAKASAPRGLAPQPIVRTVRLTDVAGCGSSEYLPGGLGATCVYQSDIGPEET
jgi:hypothetical protein